MARPCYLLVLLGQLLRCTLTDVLIVSLSMSILHCVPTNTAYSALLGSERLKTSTDAHLTFECMLAPSDLQPISEEKSSNQGVKRLHELHFSKVLDGQMLYSFKRVRKQSTLDVTTKQESKSRSLREASLSKLVGKTGLHIHELSKQTGIHVCEAGR